MSIEEDLNGLDQVIRQLQIEWEKFFGGVERKPPNDLKTRVEAQIRAIEKWNGVLPSVNSGVVPFISVQPAQQQQ